MISRPGIPTYQPKIMPDIISVIPSALTIGQCEFGGMWKCPRIVFDASATSVLNLMRQRPLLIFGASVLLLLINLLQRRIETP